jgi:hypothetical protein
MEDGSEGKHGGKGGDGDVPRDGFAKQKKNTTGKECETTDEAE